MKNIFLVTMTLSVTTLLMAHDGDTKRERLHSVRKSINTIAQEKQKSVSVVESLKHMFDDAKVSGNIRLIYADYNEKEPTTADNYATAVGGVVKYELAAFHGLNAAVSLFSANDINALSGTNAHHNAELSSSKGSYTTVGEAYINYKYDAMNLRAGRQILDTPLINNDDIRMVQDSYEAYTLGYSYKGAALLAGHVNNWQGFDADLDVGWQKTGSKGVDFAGVSYHDIWEYNLWAYKFSDALDALYVDGGIEYPFNESMTLHAMVQYLHEKELDNSGYATDIYGGMLEYVVNGLSFNLAYNQGRNTPGTMSFSGLGGGNLFTSMDTLILDDIANDRNTQFIVGGVVYEFANFSLLYAYGNATGDTNAVGQKANIVEQDVSLEYNVNDKFLLNCVYAMQQDRANSQKTEHDWNHLRVMLNYNF